MRGHWIKESVLANTFTISFAFRACWLALAVLLAPWFGSTVAATRLDPEVEQSFQLAAGSYERGQWEDAVAGFEAIIQQHGGTTEADVAHFFLGEAQMQRQEFRAAYLAWQNYLQRLPNHEFSARATFRMGEAAMRMEHTSQAIRLLEDFIEDHPRDPLVSFAMTYLGQMRLNRNEPQLAQRVFEMALHLQPNGHIGNQCRFGLARSLQLQGDHAGALRFFDFIVREPDNVLAGEARLQSGVIEFARQEFDQAAKHLTAIDLTNESTQTRGEASYWLGRVAIERDSFDLATEHFANIPFDQIDPDLAAAAQYDGAIAAIHAGDDARADTWLNQLISNDRDASLTDKARRLQVQIAQRANDSDRVIRLTNQLSESPDNDHLRDEALASIGQAAYAESNYQRTIDVFSKLLTRPNRIKRTKAKNLTQRSTWAYYQALGHLGLSEYRNAESLLRSIDTEALAKSTEPQAKSLLPLVHFAMGTSLFSQQKYAATIESYENLAIDSNDDPNARQARLELTLAYARTDRWAEARESFEQWASDQKRSATVGDTAQLLAAIARESAINSPDLDIAYWYSVMAREGNEPAVRATGLSAVVWHQLDAGDLTAANQTFETLIGNFPKHPLSADAGIAIAKHFEDQHDYAEAADRYRSVSQHFTNTKIGRTALLRRGYALQKIKSRMSLTEARQVLEQWLATANKHEDQAPLIAEALYQLAWICTDLGDNVARDAHFEKIANAHPDSKYWPDAAFRVSRGLIARREFTHAAKLLEQLTDAKKSPQRIRERSMFLRGQIEAKQQNWIAAEQTFSDLAGLTNDPTLRAKANYWLAETHYRQGKFTVARQLLTDLNESPRPALASIQPWIALRLAQSIGKAEDWGAASKVAADALASWPSFSKAYEYQFLVARELEDAGKLQEAITGYKVVIDSPRGGSTETAAIAQWRIGEIRFHQERYTDAIAAYYRVDSLFGYPRWRSASLLQAGKCQEHLQNWAHAEKLYRQLLSLFPNSDLASDAKARLVNLGSIAARTTKVQSESSDQTSKR
jgi:TolA-binding protein